MDCEERPWIVSDATPDKLNARPGRERLLQAAGELFGFSPFGDVSVSQILARSGLQAPTLYHHFGDKEGLFVEWADSAFRDLGHALRSDLEVSSSLLESLTAITRALTRENQMDVLRVLRDADRLTRTEGRDQVYAGYFQWLYEPLCAVLMRGVEHGEVRPEPLGRMAAGFVLGALSSSPNWGVPGSAPTDDHAWWPRCFLDGFGKD